MWRAPVAVWRAFRNEMVGGKARWKPFKVGKEVHTALSLLEVAALSEVSVHEEAGFVVEVEGVSFEPRTFSYCEVRFNCWEWMLRSESGFMLPRTEVLACLMIGPAIRHCSAAPNANPAHQAQKENSRLKIGVYSMKSPAWWGGFMYF